MKSSKGEKVNHFMRMLVPSVISFFGLGVIFLVGVGRMEVVLGETDMTQATVTSSTLLTNTETVDPIKTTETIQEPTTVKVIEEVTKTTTETLSTSTVTEPTITKVAPITTITDTVSTGGTTTLKAPEPIRELPRVNPPAGDENTWYSKQLLRDRTIGLTASQEGGTFTLDGQKSIPKGIDPKQNPSVEKSQVVAKTQIVREVFEKIVDEGRIDAVPADVETAMRIAGDQKFIQDDFDQDGITNFEEKSRGTDPFLADSDNDGFTDGNEVSAGYDPTKFSPGDGRDRIVFENPREVIEEEKKNERRSVSDNRYVVEKIEVIAAASPSEKNKTRFSGKALPNIYITLYIYSTPMVVTVKTDSEGKWMYDLENNLEDGDHEVYVAVTDNTGKITARSEGIGFIKTAQAVTVRPIAVASESIEGQSPLQRSRLEYFFVAFISVSLFFGIALLIISRRAATR